VFTVLIVLLSLAASLAGALSHGHDRYRTVTTARVETVAVQDAGVGSGANGPAASVTVTFGELMTNDERIE
jgi:hypothetical protein